MNFAEKLIVLRRKQGMSQEQLADHLGVTRQSVSKWESGSSVPELAKLIALSEMFQVSVDYLVKDHIEEAVFDQDDKIPFSSCGAEDDRTDALEEKITNLENYVRGYEYISKTKIGGIPLVCIRFGRMQNRNHVAKGIIAIGDIAVGVVALGGLAFGVLSAGGMAVGMIALGGLAAGVAALGGVAFGVMAFGAAAIGIVSVGVAALGEYSGGVAAVGKEIAVGVNARGRTVVGETCKGEYILQYYQGISKATVETFLAEHNPGLFPPLLKLLSWLGTVIR